MNKGVLVRWVIISCSSGHQKENSIVGCSHTFVHFLGMRFAIQIILRSDLSFFSEVENLYTFHDLR